MSAKTARSRALAAKDAVETVSAVSAATAEDFEALILAAEEAISVAIAQQQAVVTAAAAAKALDAKVRCVQDATHRAMTENDAVETVSAVSAATAGDLEALILAAEEAMSVAIGQQRAVATAAAAAKALDAKARCVQDATLRAMAENEAFAIEAAAAVAGVGAHDVQIMSNYEARSRARTENEAIIAAAEAEKYMAAQVTEAKAATARAAVAGDIANAAVKAFKAQAMGAEKTETQDLVDGAMAAVAAYGLEAQVRTAGESTPQQVPEEEEEYVAAPAVEEKITSTPSGAATQVTEIGKAPASDKRQAGFRLPPSRLHVAAAREELVTHPIQLLDEQTVLYRQDEFGLPELLSQLAGWSINLGVASVWDGGLPRAAEEFAVVCGFSAAFGPPLIEVVSIHKPTPPHVGSTMWSMYWDYEVAPFDAAERLYRLAKGCNGGAASKDDLRPFVQAVVERHPEFLDLAPDDRVRYTDTVIGILFYHHSRCGTIRLADLRASGFVPSLNGIGRLELGLEGCAYFSWTRFCEIRTTYFTLGGYSDEVRHDALKDFTLDEGVAVGAVRAQRVLDIGHWSTTTRKPAECVKSSGDECGQALEFEAFVSFFLCEEALRAGTCSPKDIRYCFSVTDATGEGWIGRAEVTPFLEDMKHKYIEDGMDDAPQARKFLAPYLDALTEGDHSEYITLKDMLKPANLQVAGRFFQELFLGTDFQERWRSEPSVAIPSGESHQAIEPPDTSEPSLTYEYLHTTTVSSSGGKLGGSGVTTATGISY